MSNPAKPASELAAESPATPPDADWASPNHVHVALLLAFTAVAIYSCYRLVVPFVPALVWALAFAVLFMPLQRRIASKLHPGIAAALSIVVIALIVVAPSALTAQRVIAEAAGWTQAIQSPEVIAKWQGILQAHPSLAPLADRIQAQVDLTATAGIVGNWIANTAGTVVRVGFVQLTGLLMTFYFLFYFLRDQKAALDAMRALSPLSRVHMNQLFSAVGDTIHATVYGTMVVAFVQGMLGGLMFWWLGVPAALLWGIVMGLLAVIPVLGAFVIWIPAAIFLLLDGSPGKALGLMLWGTIVVGGIDNVLYPILVGNRIKMHSIVAFVAIVGGLIVFGAEGLILGPVLVAVTQWLLAIWRQRNLASEPQAAAGAIAAPPSI